MQKEIVKVVAHKDTGETITFSEITNKQTGEVETVGKVMVQSKTVGNLSGLAEVKTRTAFITLKENAVEMIGKLTDGQVFPIEGKIQIVETLEPYTTKAGKLQDAKINPSTGEEILSGGQPVYRNQIFTENLKATDILLESDRATVDVEAETEVAEEVGQE